MAEESKDFDLKSLASIKSIGDAEKYVDTSLAIGGTDANTFRTLAAICYAVGAAADKKANKAPDCSGIFDHFNKRFRAASTGRKPLSDTSKSTYASAFGAWAELGFVKWKSEPTFQWLLANLDGAFTGRGSFIRD